MLQAHRMGVGAKHRNPAQYRGNNLKDNTVGDGERKLRGRGEEDGKT